MSESLNWNHFAILLGIIAGWSLVIIATARWAISTGQNGDAQALVMRRGLVRMSFANNISIANVGDNVFLVDDDRVDLAASVNNDILCGNIIGYIDATHAWVDIGPAVARGMRDAHIADPSGGSTVDSQARTAINSILAVLESKGLTNLS